MIYTEAGESFHANTNWPDRGERTGRISTPMRVSKYLDARKSRRNKCTGNIQRFRVTKTPGIAELVSKFLTSERFVVSGISYSNLTPVANDTSNILS